MDVNPIYLYYFYSNIVLFYELEVKKNPLGFRVSDNNIKLFLIASGLRITLARKGEQLVNPIEIIFQKKHLSNVRAAIDPFLYQLYIILEIVLLMLVST